MLKRLARKVVPRLFIEEEYRSYVVDKTEGLDLHGIYTVGPVSVPLDQVFIPLKLEWPTDYDIEPALGQSWGAHPYSRDLRGIGMPLPSSIERVSLGEALRRHNRLLIVGGPGTGKTTLSSFVALSFAQHKSGDIFKFDKELIPLYASVRELIGFTQDDIDFPTAYINYCRCKYLNDAIVRGWLSHGSCIIILDGLDELPRGVDRKTMLQWLDTNLFSPYPDNVFILTSRPSGTEGADPLPRFVKLELSEIELDGMIEFTRRWSIAVETTLLGDTPEAYRLAQSRAESLTLAISSDLRVQRLATNPLLLTNLALVHRYRSEIPKRRVELYDECSRIFLQYWDMTQGIAGELDMLQKQALIEPLAYRMHERQARTADQTWLTEILREELPGLAVDANRAQTLIEGIQARGGIISERAPGVFSFAHLSLQEFYTARYLASRDSGLTTLLQHEKEGWWLEVIRLYSGLRDATPIITSILSYEETLFYDGLYLAGLCLADTVVLRPDIRSKILSDLCDLYWNGEFELWRETSIAAMAEIGDPDVLQLFKQRLQDANSAIREKAALGLARLGRGDAGSEIALLRAITMDKENKVRQGAIEAIRTLGQASAAVTQQLRQIAADNNECWELRWQCAEALSLLGEKTDLIRNLLHEGLRRQRQYTGQSDEAYLDFYTRGRSAIALGRMPYHAVTEQLLVERLEDDQFFFVRKHAARSLQSIEFQENGAVQRLYEKLETAQSPQERWKAGLVLGRIQQYDHRVIETLCDGLENCEESFLRWRLAETLGFLGIRNERIINALYNALVSSETAESRIGASVALARLDQIDKSLIDTILKDLINNQNPFNPRWRCAEVLSVVNYRSTEILQTLVTLAKAEDEHWDLRVRSIDTIGSIAKGEQFVIDDLVLLLKDSNTYVRDSTLKALKRICNKSDRRLPLYLSLLGKDNRYLDKGREL